MVNLYKTKTSQQLELADFDAVTISDAISRFLAAKTAANRRPRYVTSLSYYLLQFAKGRESKPLKDFTTAEIEAWMNLYPSASSRKTWLSRLSPLFSFAVRKGFVPSNPCDRIDRVTVDMLATAPQIRMRAPMICSLPTRLPVVAKP
jgi:hypothetical protein